ncbi:hypothetical protein B0H65DRAFT_93134 [Neurospora tetraspora]|uniref:Secreted protein n=1 Tax=Neurospora tetraspora TaxID=94610 RepID=A0AAE0JJY2_9PEZI|nr:hypothetical protein B0H65DRAFT_93134 [Neurospora tetraspora]
MPLICFVSTANFLLTFMIPTFNAFSAINQCLLFARRSCRQILIQPHVGIVLFFVCQGMDGCDNWTTDLLMRTSSTPQAYLPIIVFMQIKKHHGAVGCVACDCDVLRVLLCSCFPFQGFEVSIATPGI